MLGAYNYDFPARNNGRTVLLSTDGGTHWYDQTKDIPTAPASRTGSTQTSTRWSSTRRTRCSSSRAPTAASCARAASSPTAGGLRQPRAQADEPELHRVPERCAQIPTRIDSLNAGLSTLQFTVSVNPRNTQDVQGGTQDNGTWEGLAGNPSWGQTMYGDGGQSGFDVGNPAFRFNNFYDQYTDVNFQNGDPRSGSSSPRRSSRPRSVGVLQAGDQRPGRLRNDLRRPAARLADEGQRRQPGRPRGELPRVHDPGDQAGCGDCVALGDPSGKGGPGRPAT